MVPSSDDEDDEEDYNPYSDRNKRGNSGKTSNYRDENVNYASSSNKKNYNNNDDAEAYVSSRGVPTQGNKSTRPW